MSGAAAINLGLNLYLIPRYGLVGAAVATVTSEAFTLVAGYISMRLLIRNVLRFLDWATMDLQIPLSMGRGFPHGRTHSVSGGCVTLLWGRSPVCRVREIRTDASGGLRNRGVR